MIDVLLVGVYRSKNAPYVLRLLEPALPQGWRTAWWALDRVAPALRELTVGEGGGEKLPLVNEVLRRSGVTAQWTIVSDDDLRFRNGNVVTLKNLAERAGLDLAQPARARGMDEAHAITVAIRLVRARLTTFVECGPLFVVGPRWRDRILPLPDERRMGWGLELDWFDLVAEGCRLGILDGVVIEHLGATGSQYDMESAGRLLRAELAERGSESWTPFQQTLAAWRPWQRRPPWLEDAKN